MAVWRQWPAMAITCTLALLCGALPVVGGARVLQFVAAAVALLGVLIVTRRWPVQGTLIALTVLPFLALIRRAINPSTSASDPLLALPAAFAVLCLWSPKSKQPGRTAMSTIVLLLLFVIGVEIFNPLQGPLRVGVVGAILMATPLLWFFVGRAVCTPKLLRQAANVLIVTAIVVGLYGLKQTFFGFAGFENAWVDSHFDLYVALSVSGQIRAFSTFSSSAEYGIYAGMGAAAALVVWRGWPRWAAAGFLVLCTFLTGSRGIFLLTAAALMVVLGAGRLRSLTRGVLILVPLLGLLALAANVIPVPEGESTAAVLTRRSITGLASPFDSEKSTAGTHANNITKAIGIGAGMPPGHGPGSVNQAGLALGGKTLSGESDISDILVALGYPGELLLMALYVALFKAANDGVREDRLMLVPAALAMVVFNTWFVGGLYAVTATLWFMVGALDRHGAVRGEEASAVAVPAAPPAALSAAR